MERLRIPHLKRKNVKTATKDRPQSELEPSTPRSKLLSLSTWAICDSTKVGGKKTLKYGQAVVNKARQSRAIAQQADLLACLPQASRLLVELASEKGASSWLTTLPVVELGFHLNKFGFHDGLCLRYNWPLRYLPSNCVCGQALNVERALSCAVGGLPSQRRNHMRDLTATLLSEVASNVGVEPRLLPLSGEALPLRSANTDDQARFRSVWLLGVTSRACFVRCKGVQSLCALVCDFTNRHYLPTPWTGQSAGVWAAGVWDWAGFFHTARLLGNWWHGSASKSVLQEAVQSASRPTEGQLQPNDCSCAGDAELFFAAWCDSKLVRCSIGEGALRPLCDVCWCCGRWVEVDLFAFFLFFCIFCFFFFFFFFFSLPWPVVYLFRLLFLLFTSWLSSSSLYYYSLFSYSPPFIWLMVSRLPTTFDFVLWFFLLEFLIFCCRCLKLFILLLEVHLAKKKYGRAHSASRASGGLAADLVVLLLAHGTWFILCFLWEAGIILLCNTILIPKTIGNRKGDCVWSCSRWQTQPEKISKLQSTNQYNVRSDWHWFVRCDLQIFSGCVCHLEKLQAQSPFLFPIVFGIDNGGARSGKDAKKKWRFYQALLGPVPFVPIPV